MRTASEFRSTARIALAGNWGLALAVSLVASLLGGTPGGGGSGGGSSASQNGASSGTYDLAFLRGFIPFLASIAAIVIVIVITLFIIGGAIELGHNLFYIRLISSNDTVRFSLLFDRFDVFGKALGLRLYKGLLILLWSLLFIIPGIIAAYRYSMATYIMADNPEVGVVEAIELSKDMMRFNKARLFCLQLSFIGWGLLCILTLGIGFLWLNPYIQASTAAFYLEVSGQDHRIVL